MNKANIATGRPHAYRRTNDKIIPKRQRSIGRPVVIGLLALWIVIFWALCGAVIYFRW